MEEFEVWNMPLVCKTSNFGLHEIRTLKYINYTINKSTNNVSSIVLVIQGKYTQIIVR